MNSKKTKSARVAWLFALTTAVVAFATTTANAQGPAFTVRLVDQTVYFGQTATLSSTASGDPAPTYQWYKNEVEIPGATSSTLTIPNAQASDAGVYHAMAMNMLGTAMSTHATLTVTAAPVGPFARITNVSVRTTLVANQSVLVGYTVQGGPKAMLVRAVGPSLAKFDVFNFMPDPKLRVFKGSDLVEENDNWGDADNLKIAAIAVGAFSLLPGSLDAAMIRPTEGGHTAEVFGEAGGNALLEIYDAGQGMSSRLINLSARNHVGTGANVLVAGFTLTGDGSQPVIIRAIGPTLGNFGIPDLLGDPKVEVYDSTGAKIAENDNWDASLAAKFAQVGAFSLPANSKDSALSLTLPPGGYTVQVSGVDGGTGQAMVELYEAP